MITQKMIADEVGVRTSTVSRILSGKSDSVKYSKATVEQVKETALRLGYQPNAAARALVTKRTGYIGFILADCVHSGWGNQYFASLLSGAEEAARNRGYGLNICLYNLSNLEQFVFPQSVRQRSVDGVILCGSTEIAAVEKFSEAHIPAIMIGANVAKPGIISTISFDTIEGYWKIASRYAARGHKRLLLCMGNNDASLIKEERFRSRLKAESATAHMELDTFVPPHGQIDINAAESLVAYWQSLPSSRRHTLILGSDQMMAAMTRELYARKIRCPEEVSLVSGTDTQICALTTPSLTAISYDLKGIAARAVERLTAYLDRKEPLPVLEELKGSFEGVVIERESTGPAPTMQV